MDSESRVRIALDRIAEIDAEIEEATKYLRERRDNLKRMVDEYVIENYAASEGFADDDWMATKVVGHTRKWNRDAMQKLLPAKLYKLIIKVSIDNQAVDELVRSGKINLDQISSAYEETANKPYVKVTRRNNASDKAASEAQSLAENLG